MRQRSRSMPREFRDRALHLVDIENLTGMRLPDPPAVHRERVALTGAVPFGAGDLVVVGSSHAAALASFEGWGPSTDGWGGPRFVWRSGRDGADLALLGVLEEDVTARFQHVVIASGDGIFADAASRLGAVGCAVTVVAREGGISWRLWTAVRDVRLLRPAADPAALTTAA